MAEFVEGFGSFTSPVTLMDLEPISLELMNSLPGLNASGMENSSLGMSCFSNDGFLSRQPELPVLCIDGSPVFLPMKSPSPVSEMQPVVSAVGEDGGTSERSKVRELVESASIIGSAPPGKNGSRAEVKGTKKTSSDRGKRERCSGKDKQEVTHVRAKRGEATDRHSVAERVRREKINEKMRCLQGLVPGCYKAMGMVVMLDEIIKYVRSLQNQVEFLSMKLSAACSVYDFNLDQLDDAVAMLPQLLPIVGDHADGAQEIDRLIRGRYEGCTSFHPSMPF